MSNDKLISIESGIDGAASEKPTRDYLVDSNGKLVYYFFPRAHKRVAHVQDWPGASRDWGMLWKPILAHDDEAVEIELTDGSTVGYFKGATMPRSPKASLELRWGSEETKKANNDDNAYWGLYTYAFDLPLAAYEDVKHGSPPGFLHGIWHPFDPVHGAPKVIPSSLLEDDDGPIGDLHGGGP